MNSPLAKGPGTIRANVARLMAPAKSQPRKKAILTLAKKHNISAADAQFKQSLAISRTLARKPNEPAP